MPADEGTAATWSNLETAPPQTICVFPAEPPEEVESTEAGFAQAQREVSPQRDGWFLWWDGVRYPCNLCEPPTAADNVTEELMALVRAGDEAGFRELAACVMPAGEIDECWAGARARLGLPGPPVPSAGQEQQFFGQSIVEMLGVEVLRAEFPETFREFPGHPDQAPQLDGRSITERLWESIYGVSE